MSLVIVDTGCANLASVSYAFERLGCVPLISDDAEVIKSANRVVLPGVGSAPFAMENIQAKNLKPVLKSLSQPVIVYVLACSSYLKLWKKVGRQSAA